MGAMTAGVPSMPRPRLGAVATAVPEHTFVQAEVAALGRRVFAGHGVEFERLFRVYENAGIARRHSCVPLEWYERPHGWKERSRLFRQHATKLLERAATTALDRAGVACDAVDGLLVVSSTGIAVPSLDALLMEVLSFRPDIRRLPVFGLGCAGGVLGLGRAAALARGAPDEVWLVLVVELCGLTFRSNDLSKSNLIATALFGDGAAAAVVGCGLEGPVLAGWGEHRWSGTLDVMGWRIEEDGLGVLFSRDIPALVRNEFRTALDAFLCNKDLTLSDIDHFLFHPGGEKVLDALADALRIEAVDLRHSRAILREYGNMSAATVLFVLERCLENGLGGRCLLGALGPGFTAAFALLESNV